MPRKVTIVIDLSFEDEGVIDLVPSNSSSEASSTGATTSSSSSSSDDSCQPKWTYLPNGQWLQLNDLFDDCHGADDEDSNSSADDWYQQLLSRRPQKRHVHVPSWSTKLDADMHSRPVIGFNSTYEAKCILNDCLF
jgi:hypothetical protein